MLYERVFKATSIPALVLGVLAYVVTVLPAMAQGLIRDSDIEYGLTELSFPILRAAGLSPARVRVLVVNDDSFNAFVIDHQTIFVHSGLIQKVTNARMLQAVIAHEAAHIANGHIQRRMGNAQAARSVAGLGMLLAVAAAAAGAGEAAGAIGAGVGSSATRSFLAHTRAEESSADRSAASYLTRSGIDPQGLVELHQIFAGQELLSVARQDVYARSHPFSRDRVRAAKSYVESDKTNYPDTANADYWFARIKGKLSAFTRAPKWTLRRAAEESHADIRLMREAVAYHRVRDLPTAKAKINAALELRPNDAFYYELKGQILMENRQWQAAMAAYQKAAELAPRDALILGELGRAQVAAGQVKTGLKTLEKSRARDFRNVGVLQDLSLAYAQIGNDGMAALASAEKFALMGRIEDAGIQARRAIALLPKGSPGARRATDVLSASERFMKRKKR